MPTPYAWPLASIVMPLPRLIATCATGGSPPRPGCGSLAKWKSSAPGVCSACCTVMVAPCCFSHTYWCAAPSGIVTPARAAAHFVSSEQSNEAGLGSEADARRAPHVGLALLAERGVEEPLRGDARRGCRGGRRSSPVPLPAPVRLESSDVMSGTSWSSVPPPVRLDTSDASELELGDVGPSAPLRVAAGERAASPSSDDSCRCCRSRRSSRSSRPRRRASPPATADCVLIASVSSDAKSAPVVGVGARGRGGSPAVRARRPAARSPGCAPGPRRYPRRSSGSDRPGPARVSEFTESARRRPSGRLRRLRPWPCGGGARPGRR